MKVTDDLSVFSPLHTVGAHGRSGNDDLPDLNLPDFSKSMRVTGNKGRVGKKVNTKLILDSSANSSRSSSGSGGQSTMNELRRYSKKSTRIGSSRSRISSTTSSSRTSSTITPTQQSLSLDLDEVSTLITALI